MTQIEKMTVDDVRRELEIIIESSCHITNEFLYLCDAIGKATADEQILRMIRNTLARVMTIHTTAKARSSLGGKP